jgi:hypothetical protein
MEITKKAKFITDFYGGKAFLPGDQMVQNWLESQQDRLLNPKFKQLKDAIGNEDKLEQILNVFNTNGNGEPIIGNWMLLECSMNAQKSADTWARYKVSADTWKDSVSFSPVHIPILNNGKLIKKAEFVEPYTITVKRGPNKGKSFFKAYQAIKLGASFEFTLSFPDDLCMKPEGKRANKIFMADEEKTLACVNSVLDKMGIIGLGAYRLRFGKFGYV